MMKLMEQMKRDVRRVETMASFANMGIRRCFRALRSPLRRSFPLLLSGPSKGSCFFRLSSPLLLPLLPRLSSYPFEFCSDGVAVAFLDSGKEGMGGHSPRCSL